MIRTQAGVRALVFALPGLWVLAVIVWESAASRRAPALQLLAATPAIACAGTGRRQCITMSTLCALFVLLPYGPSSTVDADVRVGTCCAILAVVGASYVITGRRMRLLRELDRAHEVAVTAQHALLRPLPPALGGVRIAAGHLCASHGTLVGGDLYEVLATAHGLRVVMGDVRGHGLTAVHTVAAVLGSFREAAHDEAELPAVLRRLERTFQRHLKDRRHVTAPARPGQERFTDEEFVTVLLLELHADGSVAALNCGHPWPHRLSATGRSSARAVPACEEPLPPLGLFPLPPELPVSRLTRLRPGDALVLHTDGAEDARDRRGTFFPLANALAEAARCTPLVPARVVERVQSALLRHTGGRITDDIALLVLGRSGAAKGALPGGS
ncbi:PP2C family protein-serine/threonine phosphatase [Streptomyces gamaensis]|uniref:PP2C family protein-serine/threonine phosphatase n=1 Tax=Streptomyces gamaensis TaxID=1763542 RepID=A0ABW0Z5V5_9ACTN